VRDQQRGHLRLVHTDAVTRDAWLCDLEQSPTYPVAIASAHLLVREPVEWPVIGSGAALRRRSRHDRRTSDSCRLAATPRSAGSGQEETFVPFASPED
jgi:hypothetical protein